MELHLRQIILWPKETTLRERRLRFRPSKINVITGWSRTGKSAITGIIDYCLGSGKCTIPAGWPIRDLVSWFSLVLVVNGKIVRVSRANPGPEMASTNYEMLHGKRAFSRVRPVQSTTLDAFKSFMDATAGLSDVGLEPGSDNSKGSARAAFRDMAAFNFLPQHVVANPYVLFFKADTTEHREKLRSIFPLVLGAVDNAYLLAKQRLSDLERDGKVLRSKVDSRNKATETWRVDALALYQRAQELGLLAPGSQPAGVEDSVVALQQIPGVLAERVRSSQAGGAAGLVGGLDQLESVEASWDRDVADLKRRLRGIKRLRSSMEGYSDTLIRHEGRLHGYSWFKEKIVDPSECPVCGSKSNTALEELHALEAPLEELHRLTATTGQAPTMLDQEMIDLERNLRSAEARLFDTRRQRLELEANMGDEEAETPSSTLEEVYRFVGRLEQALKNITLTKGDEGLEDQLKKLRDEYGRTKRALNEKGRRSAEEAAHRLLSRLISVYAESMAAERSQNNPEIDPRELTVRFTRTGDTHRDFLWEIGSGANWMAYHIATSLALHEFLLEHRTNTPVPTFLVIDQPSQVYFPSGTIEALEKNSTVSITYDDDLKNTRKIFETLELGLKRTNGRLQIILTEHANEETWRGLQQVHLVANWHSEDVDYLIPRTWMTRRSSRDQNLER